MCTNFQNFQQFSMNDFFETARLISHQQVRSFFNHTSIVSTIRNPISRQLFFIQSHQYPPIKAQINFQ